MHADRKHSNFCMHEMCPYATLLTLDWTAMTGHDKVKPGWRLCVGIDRKENRPHESSQP